MHSKDLRRRFIDFFAKKHGHAEISGASLVPENDPTVLFTTAGMHPLVPYLMGEAHPAGKRLVDAQKCLRTDDIDEVGDTSHLTFFEMMGNWSLGDYFKKEAISWSYEFLTLPVSKGGIGLDPNRLRVTCFEGDSDALRDDDAAKYWEEIGFTKFEAVPFGEQAARRLIYFYEKKKNWWGPAGQTGPCGPDTEIFYDMYPTSPAFSHRPLRNGEDPAALSALIQRYPLGPNKPNVAENIPSTKTPRLKPLLCHPNCECGRYVEIWNNVFMQYNKTAPSEFVPLSQKNVDTGLGLERVAAILQNAPTVFETDLFAPIMAIIAELSGKPLSDFSGDETISSRIIADHLRAAVFVLADPRAVRPSNTDQGYVLRRLIRRAVRHGIKLGIQEFFTVKISNVIIETYKDVYNELAKNADFIRSELQKEEDKFHSTLDQGQREFSKMIESLRALKSSILTGEMAFHLYDTYGFPLEMTKDLAKENGLSVDSENYETRFKAHQEKSRAGATQKFQGGLADNHEETVKLHTATHLLHYALRKILGEHVYQQGSNITRERLRFDFTHPSKMTPEQIKTVEDEVNKIISDDALVHYEMMTVDEAKKRGAIGIFTDKYGEKVKVYFIGDFSKEICGGPHVPRTGVIGKFKIKKEESCSSGVRRIKALVGGGATGFSFAPEKK